MQHPHSGLTDRQKSSHCESSNIFCAFKLLCYFLFCPGRPSDATPTLQDLFAARVFATGSNTTLYGQRTAAVPARLPSRVNTVKCESALGCSSTFFLLTGV